MVATFSTQKPRGRPFEKGITKIGGRKKGALNIHSRGVRLMIAEAAHGLGGVPRLIAWAKVDPWNGRASWPSTWPRLLPWQVQGTGAHDEIELNLKNRSLGAGEADAGARAPADHVWEGKPVLELEAPPVEGSGGAEPV